MSKFTELAERIGHSVSIARQQPISSLLFFAVGTCAALFALASAYEAWDIYLEIGSYSDIAHPKTIAYVTGLRGLLGHAKTNGFAAAALAVVAFFAGMRMATNRR